MSEAGPSAQWREALSKGRFLIQRSVFTGAHVFPPRVVAPGNGEDDLDWVEARGTGAVYAVTIVRPRSPAEPYNVVLVELDEGPRLMSRVVDADTVAIGQRVRAFIDVADGEPILLFRPDTTG